MTTLGWRHPDHGAPLPGPQPGERKEINVDLDRFEDDVAEWTAKGWRLLSAVTRNITLKTGERFRRVDVALEYAP